MSDDIYTFDSNAAKVVLTPITMDSFKVLSRSTSETLSPNRPGIPVAQSSMNETIKRKRYPRHPPIRKMVDEAIFEKGYMKGLSLAGIKKFLTEKYFLNIKRSAQRIREYIKESVQNGRYIRKTGRGANGSFRLSPNIRKSFNKNAKKVTRKSKINTKEEMTTHDTEKLKIGVPKGQKRKTEMPSNSPTTPKKLKNDDVFASRLAKMRAI